MSQKLWFVTLVLADGRALTYSGPHELRAHDRVTNILASSIDLPVDCHFETLGKETTDADDR